MATQFHAEMKSRAHTTAEGEKRMCAMFGKIKVGVEKQIYLLARAKFNVLGGVGRAAR